MAAAAEGEKTGSGKGVRGEQGGIPPDLEPERTETADNFPFRHKPSCLPRLQRTEWKWNHQLLTPPNPNPSPAQPSTTNLLWVPAFRAARWKIVEKPRDTRHPTLLGIDFSGHLVLKSFLQVQPNLTIDVITSFYSTAHHQAVISLDFMQLTFYFPFFVPVYLILPFIIISCSTSVFFFVCSFSWSVQCHVALRLDRHTTNQGLKNYYIINGWIQCGF